MLTPPLSSASAAPPSWLSAVFCHVEQITKFLNEFEVSVRYKLSSLAERVGTLERHLEFCETAVKSKEHAPQLTSSNNGMVTPTSGFEHMPSPGGH